MTREQILTEIRKFFDVDELVCDHAYAKYGERSWQFLDTNFLETLLIVRRDILKKPMWCNNHRQGTHQRGIRCNRCNMVRGKSTVYLSAHVLGKAGDFTVTDMTAEQARNLIIQNADRLPYPVRLERGVSWLHLDVIPQYGINQKVYLFTA